MLKHSMSKFAFVVLPLIGGASVAHAGFTTVGAPHGKELSHADILGQLYGGDFVPSGLGFTNGGLVFDRVDDDVDAPATIGALTDVVREAGITSSTLAFTASGPVLTSKGVEYFAKPSDNVDGLDHLVLYHAPVEGDLSELYVLFWNDGFGDADFQDYVVGTAIGAPQIPAVPLPPALVGGLACIVPFALNHLRRRKTV